MTAAAATLGERHREPWFSPSPVPVTERPSLGARLCLRQAASDAAYARECEMRSLGADGVRSYDAAVFAAGYADAAPREGARS